MKILMFTVSAGNGHNSTAKRLKEKIENNNPNAEIEIVDVYKEYASKLKAWTMEQGYFLACNHFVSIYNHFFKKSEKSDYDNRDKSKANKEIYPIMYGMLNKIYEYQPDVIISTYIFCAVALSNLKRYYKIPATTICMTLDYGVSPYWECCADGLDYMFLTDNYMLDTFKAKGFKDKQLIVAGIPVADKFSTPLPKLEARKILNLDENLFTIVIMKGSFFPVSNGDIIKQLSLVNEKIQVIIINGKDKKCQDDLDKRLSKAKLKHNIVNLGFTNQVVEYFSASDLILGKAGGLSTTESINAGIPSLIVDKLPQQEIYNKMFLINHGCALPVTNKDIAEKINYLIENPNEYNNLKNATLNLRKTDTLDKFYNVINDCPKADYSDIHFGDNKRQVIKNVDKQRRLSIKKNKNS